MPQNLCNTSPVHSNLVECKIMVKFPPRDWLGRTVDNLGVLRISKQHVCNCELLGQMVPRLWRAGPLSSVHGEQPSQPKRNHKASAFSFFFQKVLACICWLCLCTLKTMVILPQKDRIHYSSKQNRYVEIETMLLLTTDVLNDTVLYV